MILLSVFLMGAFNISAMIRKGDKWPVQSWEFGFEDFSEVWQSTKEELINLGMKDTNLDESIPKDFPLSQIELTPFWKTKEEASQEEKNKLLSKILSLTYPDKFYNLERLHIASAVISGAKPNGERREGYCILAIACLMEDIQLVSFLLQKGADPNFNIQDLRDTPLYNAYYKKNEKIARLLLAYGANPEKQLSDLPRLKWCLKIQLQMQKEQEDGLKFQAARAVLKKYPVIEQVKNVSTKLPDELFNYLEETKKILN